MEVPEIHGLPPKTRYQGSKRKLLNWIWDKIGGLAFDSSLDLFGGTGCVAYHLKAAGKQVTYNDYLKCNQLIKFLFDSWQNLVVRISAQ